MLSNGAAAFVIFVGGVISVVTDLRARRVPNWLTGTLMAVGLLFGAAHVGRMNVGAAIAGGVVGLLLMLPGYVIAGTGAGDVKLLIGMGTLLGPRRTAIAFLFSAIVGGVLAVLFAIKRGRVRMSFTNVARLIYSGGANVAEITHSATDNRFPYAPALAIGTLAALLGS